MKTSIRLSAGKIILLGSVLLSLVFYFGFSFGRASAPINGNVITVQDAKRYFSNYKTNAPVSHDGIVNAMIVDIAQYEAMKMVLQNVNGTTGFRIYYGLDDKNQNVRMVAGIGADGKDQTNYIVATSVLSSGLCPPVCDSPSGGPGEE